MEEFRFVHAKLLHRLQHDHIVYLHGVCMEELPYFLVFELMDQSNLCEFLRMHSNTLRYNPPNALKGCAGEVHKGPILEEKGEKERERGGEGRRERERER